MKSDLNCMNDFDINDTDMMQFLKDLHKNVKKLTIWLLWP